MTNLGNMFAFSSALAALCCYGACCKFLRSFAFSRKLIMRFYSMLSCSPPQQEPAAAGKFTVPLSDQVPSDPVASPQPAALYGPCAIHSTSYPFTSPPSTLSSGIFFIF